MAKKMRRTLLYGVLLIAGVTLGMQMAETGTADIYGSGMQPNNYRAPGGAGQTPPPYYNVPTQQNGSFAWQTAVAPGAAGYAGGYGANGTIPPSAISEGNSQAQQTEGMLQTPADLLLPKQPPPAVDRFADKTARLLQQVSQKSIHWLASLISPSDLNR